MNFLNRSSKRELMDDLSLDTEHLQKIYADINRVNKVLQGFSISLGAIKKIMEENPQESYAIMDVGCGDGAMLRKVASYFKGSSLELKLTGIDLNPRSIQLARESSREYPYINFVVQDILAMESNNLQCDILMCSLTMHHFDNMEIPVFLNQFVKLSRLGVIINDLQRSQVAYYLFQLFSLIFMRTKVAKHDGLVSIKSAFTKEDLMTYSYDLPKVKHHIRWRWAFRYLWVIHIEQENI